MDHIFTPQILNSFFPSRFIALTKLRDCVLLFSPLVRKRWIDTFPNDINAKCKQLCSKFLLDFLFFTNNHYTNHTSIYFDFIIVCIYLRTPLDAQDVIQGQFFFQVEFNRFEFRVFLLLDQLPY